MGKRFTDAVLLAAGAVLALAAGEALAQAPGCASCGKCPPPFKWHSEKPPCIKFHHACPRPVCDPCSLQHYGYYQTCWRPWNFPADWSHCPTPPPGAVLPPPPYPPYTPKAPYVRPPMPEPVERRKDDLPAPRPSEPAVPMVRITAVR